MALISAGSCRGLFCLGLVSQTLVYIIKLHRYSFDDTRTLLRKRFHNNFLTFLFLLKSLSRYFFKTCILLPSRSNRRRTWSSTRLLRGTRKHGMAENCSNPKRRMALLESPIFKTRRIRTNYNT